MFFFSLPLIHIKETERANRSKSLGHRLQVIGSCVDAPAVSP